MLTVGVRELKRHASELLRRVREEGQTIQVTHRGVVVALIVPVERPPASDTAAWEALDTLAAEIGARWPAGVSSVEAVAEVRE